MSVGLAKMEVRLQKDGRNRKKLKTEKKLSLSVSEQSHREE